VDGQYLGIALRQLAVQRGELPYRRLRGERQHARLIQQLVKSVRFDVNAFTIRFLTQRHRQRHHVHAVLFQLFRGKAYIRPAVCYDLHTPHSKP